ncbi:glycosyltransferase family 2 protein [Bifidobacterium sp.]|uniref:glycosyltransferase family 2 protein n=1 Tax=unclassified Bifidobacterium TaxID=2608897 RepID=UPI002A91E580|nr:glycosyltransferase [Bifidobacterium sp.]MDY5368323.1 glycosyltransferase [Bifidobacterium sp.]
MNNRQFKESIPVISESPAPAKSQSAPLVTIIIPAYNAEDFLPDCMSSVVRQTYTNLEILVIDDGSTDRTPSICDTWEHKDLRVHAMHQSNAGVSVARNNGLDHATGEYVMFIDSDDMIEPNTVEIMLDRAMHNRSQIVFCANWDGHMVQNEWKPLRHNTYYDFSTNTNREFIGWFGKLVDASYVFAPWGKLFERTFIEQCGARFPVGVIVGEDSIFNFQLYTKTKRVSCVPQALYRYIIRGTSAMSSFKTQWFTDRRDVYRHLLPTIQRWNPGYLNRHRLGFIYDLDIILGNLYGHQHDCTGRARLAFIRGIATDPVVIECATHVRPQKMRDTMITKLLRTHSPRIFSLYAWFIGMLKRILHR